MNLSQRWLRRLILGTTTAICFIIVKCWQRRRQQRTILAGSRKGLNSDSSSNVTIAVAGSKTEANSVAAVAVPGNAKVAQEAHGESSQIAPAVPSHIEVTPEGDGDTSQIQVTEVESGKAEVPPEGDGEGSRVVASVSGQGSIESGHDRSQVLMAEVQPQAPPIQLAPEAKVAEPVEASEVDGHNTPTTMEVVQPISTTNDSAADNPIIADTVTVTKIIEPCGVGQSDVHPASTSAGAVEPLVVVGADGQAGSAMIDSAITTPDAGNGSGEGPCPSTIKVAGGTDGSVGASGDKVQSRRRKPEGAIKKGFFNNKPKKKQPPNRDPVKSSTNVAAVNTAGNAQVSNNTDIAVEAYGQSHSSTAVGVHDTEDVGEAALRVANETIAAEQDVGTRCFHARRYRESRAAFERMRDAARGAGLSRKEGEAHRLIANTLDKLDAPETEIEDAYKQALKIAHQQDDMSLSFNVLTGMGSHAMKIGDLELSEHFYLQSLTLAQRVLEDRDQAIAEGNLGMCLAQVEGRKAESFSHFRKALALQQRPDADPHSVVILSANFASALAADGKNKEAITEYERALVVARAAEDRRTEVNILMNLANLTDPDAPDQARGYRQALVAATGQNSNEAGTVDCAVCLEPLESDGATRRPVIVLPCLHAYHQSCWENCEPNNPDERMRCPLCRKGVSFLST